MLLNVGIAYVLGIIFMRVNREYITENQSGGAG